MRSLSVVIPVLATSLAFAQPALANAPADLPVFAADRIDEATLAGVRGTQSPFATLTRGSATRLQEAQFWSDQRQFGAIARVTMDLWWGETGATLVANSVRAAGQ